MFLTEENEKLVLDYLCSGNGMIPYQMIPSFDSLNISTLKEKNISEEEYENI